MYHGYEETFSKADGEEGRQENRTTQGEEEGLGDDCSHGIKAEGGEASDRSNHQRQAGEAATWDEEGRQGSGTEAARQGSGWNGRLQEL